MYKNLGQIETRSEQAHQNRYLVLVNYEEQYSLWPSTKLIPAGWKLILCESTKEECLAYIDKVWTDMRPLSLRNNIKR